MRKLITFAFLALSGCSYTKPLFIAPMALGPKEKPIAIGRGQSGAAYVLGFRLAGDDSLEEAVKNAKEKSKTPDTTMANVFVDRHLFCFPACWLPLYMESLISIYGTIITYDVEKETPKDAHSL